MEAQTQFGHWRLKMRFRRTAKIANRIKPKFPEISGSSQMEGPFRFGPTGIFGTTTEVVLFDRSVRSDRNVAFHLQKKSFPVPFHCDVTEILVET